LRIIIISETKRINELEEENNQLKTNNDILINRIQAQESLYINFKDQYNYQCQLVQLLNNQQSEIELLINQNLGYKLELEGVKEKIDKNEKLKQIIANKEDNLKRYKSVYSIIFYQFQMF